MIKVLHFFKTYYPETMGGIEQVIFQIAEGGITHGFESEVLYLSERGAARNEKVGHHLTHRSRLDLHVASTGFSLSAFKDFCRVGEDGGRYSLPLSLALHGSGALLQPNQKAHCRQLSLGYR